MPSIIENQDMKVLKIVVFVLASISLLDAQLIDTSFLLQDVMISSSRISTPFNETSRSIEVIHADEIANLPATSLAGILQHAISIDIRQRGPNGVQADIGIRGGGFEQTLILVNGFKMTDPQTGHHIMNIPISPENIERIEIIKGPAARIYGQNAFAGAINIVTKTPDKLFSRIRTRLGQNQLMTLGIDISVPGKKANHYLSIDRNISQGYRYNSDYDITNLLYQSEFSLLGKKTSIFAGFTERKFGANGFYASENFRDQYEEVQTSMVGIQSTILQGDWVHKPRVYWRRNQDMYLFVRSNPSLYRNMHIGNNIGAEWNSTLTTGLGISGIGIELRNENLASTNLGNRQRSLASAYLEQRMTFQRLDITPGISFQYYSDFGPQFFYGLDLGFKVNETTLLFGNIGTTYRVPSYTDRFYSDPANEGNPDLLPETALTYELGLRIRKKGLTLQSSIFRREGSDLIDWTRDTLISPRWTPVNLNRVPVNGLEVSLKSDLKKLIPLYFMGLQSINYTYIDAEIIDNQALESRYLLENLRHQFQYSGDFDFKYFHAIVSYRYFDRVNLDNYDLIDVRLSRRFESTKLFLDINNLLNVEYKETNLVPMPGRWIILGADFKLF